MSNQDLCKTLAIVLADTYSLYLKTQNFHWNITGPQFKALHEMFEDQYNNLNDAVDELAERIRSLGEHAPGGFKEFSDIRTIDDAPKDHTLSGNDMLQALIADHKQVITSLKNCQQLAEQQNDEVTVDMMVHRLSFHEKTCWMLQSSL